MFCPISSYPHDTLSEIPEKGAEGITYIMREIKFKNYLLGTISELERTAIDHSIITNEEEFEQLLMTEDDLIEAYLREALTVTERTQFEQFFLADPERQQKLRLARALHRYANDPTKSSPVQEKAAATNATAIPWWSIFRRPLGQLAMAGVLLLVVVLGYQSLVKSPAITIQPTGTEVAFIELTPGKTRSVGKKPDPINLSPNIGTVQIKLHLKEPIYPEYEATLLPDENSDEGQKLTGRFKPQKEKELTFVLITIPVTMLQNGESRIKLEVVPATGTESVGTYSFTVNRGS